MLKEGKHILVKSFNKHFPLQEMADSRIVMEEFSWCYLSPFSQRFFARSSILPDKYTSSQTNCSTKSSFCIIEVVAPPNPLEVSPLVTPAGSYRNGKNKLKRFTTDI